MTYGDLRQVSTQWSRLADANTFVLRYADPARRYLERLLGNRDDAEEVLQTFLTRVLERGFERANPDRGRFRDYLIRALKNEAHTYRRQRARRTFFRLSRMRSEPEDDPSAAAAWESEWRECVLDQAWKALRGHQQTHPGNYCHTILTVVGEHPRASSPELARLVNEREQARLSPPAFRKQLSRARRLFAELLVRQVAETLDQPTPENVREELVELRLLEFVREYLPESWRVG